MATIAPLSTLEVAQFETPHILRRVVAAGRQLAELKGTAASIPHQGILINALGLQEAKDSSAIENIVTTHDELFRDDPLENALGSPATKEVQRYRQALRVGYEAVRETGILTINHILQVQAALERNSAGFRSVPGTTLRDGAGRVVYTPPQDAVQVRALMHDLELFVNDAMPFDADPLVKMAVMHHQFESIHPFYDGNGRTGRILNVLYLVRHRLLDAPILYLSRFIVRTKADYYRLLQSVRDTGEWEPWVLYVLEGVEATAREGIATVTAIRDALLRTKHQLRAELPRIYSQDLLNNLFTHPYTKIAFVEQELGVSRLTATRYLDALAERGFVVKQRIGRSNYYVNVALCRILTGEPLAVSSTDGADGDR